MENITINIIADSDIEVEMEEEIDYGVGDIITYDDGIVAVVMDTLGDTLYVYNENGCIEKIKKEYAEMTDMCTDLVQALQLMLQEGID